MHYHMVLRQDVDKPVPKIRWPSRNPAYKTPIWLCTRPRWILHHFWNGIRPRKWPHSLRRVGPTFLTFPIRTPTTQAPKTIRWRQIWISGEGRRQDVSTVKRWSRRIHWWWIICGTRLPNQWDNGVKSRTSSYNVPINRFQALSWSVGTNQETRPLLWQVFYDLRLGLVSWLVPTLQLRAWKRLIGTL